jgi:hypothetical protein
MRSRSKLLAEGLLKGYIWYTCPVADCARRAQNRQKGLSQHITFSVDPAHQQYKATGGRPYKARCSLQGCKGKDVTDTLEEHVVKHERFLGEQPHAQVPSVRRVDGVTSRRG